MCFCSSTLEIIRYAFTHTPQQAKKIMEKHLEPAFSQDIFETLTNTYYDIRRFKNVQNNKNAPSEMISTHCGLLQSQNFRKLTSSKDH